MATENRGADHPWIADLIGFLDRPVAAGSGGNMANFVGFLAARAAKAAHVRASGVRAGATLRVYASSETHTWIQKAADLFGLGTDAIPMDPGRCRSTDGRDRPERQMSPIARAETCRCSSWAPLAPVSTGAVDPLAAIAACCVRHDVWFHVDGAYGAVAALVPGAPEDLRAIAEADSVAVDPHKWLYAPLEAGCALVGARRSAARVLVPPELLPLRSGRHELLRLRPQNSRGFRALKVWLALRQVGRPAICR
jgi:glutamate/tyrosine decarboxylase-like PLP-dependent enzyme